MGVVRVHDKRLAGGETPAEINHQTHYWALRQQARHLFALLFGEPEVVVTAGIGSASYEGVWLLSLHLWWWGVVFDLWIVVASI